MFKLSYLAIAAFGFGLVLTLVLAAWLTPSRWWRQLNARAIAIVGLGTWAIGSMVLWLAQAQAGPAPARMAATPASNAIAPVSMMLPGAGRSYRVHEDLNLRAARGTDARRIAVVPAGTLVTTTGAGEGDWWQVRARVEGRDVLGWSSSLWLRRADEPAL